MLIRILMFSKPILCENIKMDFLCDPRQNPRQNPSLGSFWIFYSPLGFLTFFFLSNLRKTPDWLSGLSSGIDLYFHILFPAYVTFCSLDINISTSIHIDEKWHPGQRPQTKIRNLQMCYYLDITRILLILRNKCYFYRYYGKSNDMLISYRSIRVRPIIAGPLCPPLHFSLL